jgi:SAM-dependent methyltransferase
VARRFMISSVIGGPSDRPTTAPCLSGQPSLPRYKTFVSRCWLKATSLLAMQHSLRAIEIEETVETKAQFVQCARALESRIPNPGKVLQLAIRALSEPWGRPNDLVYVSARLLEMEPSIKECIDDAVSGSAVSINLLRSSSVCGNDLLHCLLVSAPINDFGLERFLRASRRAILDFTLRLTAKDLVEQNLIEFACALAEQCFINEYVYWYDDEEFENACHLRERLAAMCAGHPAPELAIAVVAAYFPLHSLSDRLFLRTSWSDGVARLIRQQILASQQESRYRATLPCLTSIADEVSASVRCQYEENPYPRWVKTAVMAEPTTACEYLRKTFPQAWLGCFEKDEPTEILIAGCGTGQQSIETAMRLRNVRVLAVDLSFPSLCYAVRKTKEAGLANICYAQADILSMDSSDFTFDLIEAMGVLHHLRDPFAGWLSLLSLLRPGGFMRVGLYSEVARQELSEVREFISIGGYKPSSSDIRTFRQQFARSGIKSFDQLARTVDFYSVSGCRDALFNVQEHRMTLRGINDFLRNNHLQFMGFTLDANTLLRFRQRFPLASSATDLDLWHQFEIENPQTFIRMYQFWKRQSRVVTAPVPRKSRDNIGTA